MVATTLHLPEELRQLAEVAAQSRGMSLDEFVCDSLKTSLGHAADADPFFADKAVFHGDAPEDLSAEHDRYLYGENS